MRVKINSTGEIKEVKQVGDKLFDKENNCYSLGQVTVLEEWHSASELPPVDESGNSAELIAITCDNNLMKVYFHYESEVYNFWVESDDWNKRVKYGVVNVKWWCYPPKEE